MGDAKIFGIGLNRTATTSLHMALRGLGLRSEHHPEDPLTSQEVTRCLRTGCTELRLTLLTEYDALLDAPVAATYKALDRAYPGSRFILTVRKVEDWLRSCEAWWPLTEMHRQVFRQPGPLSEFFQAVYTSLYGSVEFDRELYAQAYEHHVEGVLEHFRDRPEDLLVLDVFEGHGWPELCRFLEIPEPDEPFPFVNRLADHPTSLRPVYAAALATIVQPGEAVALADSGLGIALPPDRTVLALPDPDVGLPADSEGAIAQSQRAIGAGADWIAFCGPAFWWLEEYVGLREYLEGHSQVVERRDGVVAFRAG